MPSTYTLISSNVLTSSAASVTFSSIPATYTDLVLRVSVRSTASSTTDTGFLQLNSITSNYSGTRLVGSGSSATSAQSLSASSIRLFNLNGDTTTSNTFSSVEFYLPNYTASTNKPGSLISAQENNASTAYITATATLLSNTDAINAMTFSLNSGNIASGSSFYLYGIKNS